MNILSENNKKSLEKNCHYINNKCIQACSCYIENINTNCYNDNNNIIRKFDDYDLYKWEIDIYLHLLNTKIIPLINSKNYEICYILNGYISLRNFLNEKENKKDEKISLILNELYSFINTFKKHRFIHGNLHIDNIFIKQLRKNTKGDKTIYDFKVIDYANSYIIKKGFENKKFNKTSFLGEYNIKEKHHMLLYWDFFTTYVSLKTFFKNKVYSLYKLQDIVESYIPNNIFAIMLKDIIIKQIFNPFMFHSEFFN